MTTMMYVNEAVAIEKQMVAMAWSQQKATKRLTAPA
jgi:hypothetical protein